MPDKRSLLASRNASQRRLYLAGSIAVLVLAFYPLMLPGRLLAAGDLPFFHLPLRTLFKNAVEAGFPWWNSALNGGQPILSNPNYAAFYPPSWLALILPVPVALHLILLLHAGWAFAGSWKLARHLGCGRPAAMLAATAFALGGSLVSTAPILTLFCGLSWVPWVVLWGHRVVTEKVWFRPTCLLGLGLAAQFLAGEPVACIISGIALLGVALDGLASGSRAGFRLAAGIALSIALAGVQLVPTAVRLADSPRGSGELETRAGLRSMHPARFAELAVAHPLGDPHRVDEGLFFGQRLNDKGFPYIVSIYPGILIAILALAGLARPGIALRWTWITMLLLGGMLAIGRHNPLYLGGIAHLPVLDQIRYPEKYILAAMAALPFAAALKWDRLLNRSESEHRGERSLAVLLSAVATGLTAVLIALFLIVPAAPAWLAASLLDGPLTPDQASDVIGFARQELFVTLGVVGSVCLLLTLGRRLPKPWLAMAAVALLAGDLAWQNRYALQVVPTSSVVETPGPLTGISTDDRVFTDLMFAGEATVPLRYVQSGPDHYWHGLETAEPYIATLWGYSYALNVDYDLMLTKSGQHALNALSEDWSTPHRARRLLGAWNVGSILLHRPLTDVLLDRYQGRPAPRLALTPNPDRLPLVRALSTVIFHPDLDSALAAARDHDYDLAEHGHWVVEPGRDLGRTESVDGGAAEIEIEHRKPGWLRISTRAPDGVFVQIAVTFDSGWRATVDGGSATIHQTATGQMGIEIPAGEHSLEVRFRDPAVLLGALLSLGGVLILGILWTGAARVQR